MDIMVKGWGLFSWMMFAAMGWNTGSMIARIQDYKYRTVGTTKMLLWSADQVSNISYIIVESVNILVSYFF